MEPQKRRVLATLQLISTGMLIAKLRGVFELQAKVKAGLDPDSGPPTGSFQQLAEQPRGESVLTPVCVCVC